MRFALYVVAVALLCASTRAEENVGDDVVSVVDGSRIPSNLCMTNDELHDATESMLDDFVSFGITDKHAEEFTGWIISDVVIAANKSEDMKCVPPSRTDEMGNRLGKIIAQDIAGERPEKRGRPELDGEVQIDIDFDKEVHRKTLDKTGAELPSPTSRQGEEKKEHGKQSTNGPTNGGGDKGKGAKSSFKFNFLEEKKRDGSPVKTNCCKCPQFHYPEKWDKTCSKGPCCPSLCRTLERLAGPLSSAKIPCCEKAHRGCKKRDRLGLFNMMVQRKPSPFKFSFEKHLDSKKSDQKKNKQG